MENKLRCGDSEVLRRLNPLLPWQRCAEISREGIIQLFDVLNGGSERVTESDVFERLRMNSSRLPTRRASPPLAAPPPPFRPSGCKSAELQASRRSQNTEVSAALIPAGLLIKPLAQTLGVQGGPSIWPQPSSRPGPTLTLPRHSQTCGAPTDAAATSLDHYTAKRREH